MLHLFMPSFAVFPNCYVNVTFHHLQRVSSGISKNAITCSALNVTCLFYFILDTIGNDYDYTVVN